MQITVLFFAYLKELAKADQGSYDLAPSSTIEALGNLLAKDNRAIGEMLPSCRIAVNEEWRTWGTQLIDGDVVAFIPPVSGG